jgi:hypothetical protein
MNILKEIFGKKKKEFTTREEYWKYWDIEGLLDDLNDAIKIVSKYSGGYSGDMISAEEFTQRLREEVDNIKQQDFPDLNLIWLWFAPTCHWDDFTSSEDSDIANRIFEKVSIWKNETERK